VLAAIALATVAGDVAAKGEGPTAIAAGFGSLWIGMGNGEVLRFDARSERLEARFKAGPQAFVHALAVGDDALWVLRDRLTRIDARLDHVRDLPRTASPTGFALAAGAGSVWIADDGRNEIVRVDPRLRRVVARVRVPGRAAGVAAGPRGAVVLSVPTSGPITGPDGPRLLRRIDIDNGKLSRPLVRVTCDVGVTVGARAVWTYNACTGVLARRDRRTLAVLRQRAMHVLSQSPAFGFGSLWLARRGGTLRVDPVTLRVVAEIPARSVVVTIGAGYVWAFDAGNPGRRPTIRRIDPRTNRLSGRPIKLRS
jgi:virginiamycin B lyase